MAQELYFYFTEPQTQKWSKRSWKIIPWTQSSDDIESYQKSSPAKRYLDSHNLQPTGLTVQTCSWSPLSVNTALKSILGLGCIAVGHSYTCPRCCQVQQPVPLPGCCRSRAWDLQAPEYFTKASRSLSCPLVRHRRMWGFQNMGYGVPEIN